ncbi:hypothetical protein GRF59_15155 [Paenibacillus sp. HJL G12]|uniref:Uncharacterized protein n=1 Tax=Paenibacillus dendrobii TaxID=2691084 RepID=A0A7X3LJ36_9BACL|nr:hypothetical protein [Paenibacillus dendrobii]MWV44959.1 hypothetical protein [Paenibacillus dendrobii]
MTEAEYLQGEPENEPDNDLPSAFLSDEDLPSNTNVVIIPSYKPNIELILDNYVDQVIKVKNKVQLKEALSSIWNHAAYHGAISERLDKLQDDVEMLQIDLLSMAGYEIEFIDGDEG